jgi:hypothetical protein
MFLSKVGNTSSRLCIRPQLVRFTARAASCNLKIWAAGNCTWISSWPTTLIAPTMIVDPARSLMRANWIAVRIEAGEKNFHEYLK